MIAPDSSNIFRSFGIAVISFDFESTATWPNVSPCVVAHALTSQRPKIRYLVGLDAKIVSILANLLPARAVDWLLARQRGLDG